ncbi:MAG: phosphate/phosphite/phosphonate ABC transporter substrate-binding protein [Deltaproteobacteria bacterium]|nr:phosphate/phosphite/phosphonate ABC transporter substrate-binding protein [Deltaproteobacteria bacterium]
MGHRRILFAFLSICFFIFSSKLAFSKEVVQFGFCPKYNPRIMYQLYQPFVDYLNESTPYRFEIKLSRVYQETIHRLGRKEITIASCGPVSYVIAREKYPVRPILRTLNKDGKPFYWGMIVVRQDSPIRDLRDLKGKSFAFGQAWSTAGHILPEHYLARANVRLKDLKSYSFLKHHDSVVQAVLKGDVDAGAVKDVIAYKYQGNGLRFIFITDPIPTVPIVVRADGPKEMVESVKAALLKLNPKNPAHQKKMVHWDEEFKYGFTEAFDSDYHPIRKIYQMITKDQEGEGCNQD